MTVPFPPEPYDVLLAAVMVGAAAVAYVRGTRSFARGVRDPDHPRQTMRVVRGFRGWILGGGFLFLAGGLVFHATWPVLFGLVFLAEELVETGVMLAALRRDPDMRRGT